MGAYCLTKGQFVAAELGEELSIKQFLHTFAVVNAKGQPVCIPHGGCTLEFISVDPSLWEHSALRVLQPSQTAHYEIQGTFQRERDIVTLKTGQIVGLRELGSSIFQITQERPS